MRNILSAKIDDIALTYTNGTWLQGNEGAGCFAPFFVWHRDDGRFHDYRMALQGLLHFEAGDIFAARDNDVLGPILDLDITVRVHYA